jgi:predicted PurR-regulated permease PerM
MSADQEPTALHAEARAPATQRWIFGIALALLGFWVARTFVGIFGGMYSFGLVGLFIGPAIMAALFLVWSEWQGLEPPRGERAKKRAG